MTAGSTNANKILVTQATRPYYIRASSSERPASCPPSGHNDARVWRAFPEVRNCSAHFSPFTKGGGERRHGNGGG